MILTVIFAICVVGLGIAIIGWRRNGAVYAFRTALNDEIYRLDTEDAEAVYQAKLAGDTSATYTESWRREEHPVTYEQMMRQFWRPLASFYREDFPELPMETESQGD